MTRSNSISASFHCCLWAERSVGCFREFSHDDQHRFSGIGRGVIADLDANHVPGFPSILMATASKGAAALFAERSYRALLAEYERTADWALAHGRG